jgi:hypothetical protein
MPSPPSPASDWFHRKRQAPKDPHKIFLSRLLSMLAGDRSQRVPPPPTLPGRPPAPPAASAAPPPSAWRPDNRWERPEPPARKAVGNGDRDTERDGDPPYSREQLELMNHRFVTALERAIENGNEKPGA